MTHVGQLLRKARLESGLTQATLARLARTSQPAVARYERGASVPTLATLSRLLRACGRELELGAVAHPHQAAGVSDDQRIRLGEAARVRGVSAVRVFGSYARGEAGADSDVDLLVELEGGRTLLDLAGFRRDASRILRRSVDVATAEMLKPAIRERVIAEARRL